jgi:PST family polysaccharide transporter
MGPAEGPAASPVIGLVGPAAAPPATQSSSDRSLIHGIAWTGGAKWISQIVTWASTILVARILSPDDYGLVGMAAVFMGLVTLLSEFGLGSALVTLRSLDDRQVSQLNTLSVLVGVGAFVLTCMAAIPISRFFGAPRLTWVLVVLATGFIVAGFRTVPDAALQKELEFRTLALVEAAQAVFIALTTVMLAVAGLRYWTLVLGTLLGGLFATVAAVVLRPRRFVWPEWASLRDAISFSRQILVSRIAWYVYSSSDFLVVGRVLGQTALGYYSFAWSLASIPVAKLSSLVVRVTPAHFAAVQDDHVKLRRYLLGLTEALSLLSFPATVGLALVAEEFVLLMLGEKWRAAIPALQLLAAYASLRSITPLLPQILTATRETRFVMRNSAMAAVVLPVAFIIGTRWGIAGVAIAWLLVHPFVVLPLFARVFKRLQLPVTAYLRSLFPAVSGCVVMVVCVAAVQWLAPPGTSVLLLFSGKVLAGATGYLATLMTFHRDRVAAFRAVLAAARS